MTTNPGSPLRPELWRLLRREFRLDWQGIHGVPHWSRVLVHGRYLAAQTGAALRVVELFAVLHDVKRKHDGQDPEHGLRAADFADWLHRRSQIELAQGELPLLLEALRGHSDGRLEADLTVQACWDADRLDLGRVCVIPDPRMLCTTAARSPAYIGRAVAWAMRRPRGTMDDSGASSPSRGAAQ